LRRIFCPQSLGFRDRIPFLAQADEDRGIAVIANPLKTSRDRLRRRRLARAVRGEDRSDGFAHAQPRSSRRRSLGNCAPGAV